MKSYWRFFECSSSFVVHTSICYLLSIICTTYITQNTHLFMNTKIFFTKVHFFMFFYVHTYIHTYVHIYTHTHKLLKQRTSRKRRKITSNERSASIILALCRKYWIAKKKSTFSNFTLRFSCIHVCFECIIGALYTRIKNSFKK